MTLRNKIFFVGIKPLAIVLCFFVVISLVAQRPKPRMYMVDDEATRHSGIFFTDVQQDYRGFIWFSTIGGGIFKYDGSEMTQFANSIPTVGGGIRIRKCADNRLWFMSYSGKIHYLIDDSIVQYEYNDSILHLTRKGNVISYHVDTFGTLHLGVRHKGYYTVSKDGKLSCVIGPKHGYKGIVHVTLSNKFFLTFKMGDKDKEKSNRVYFINKNLCLIRSQVLPIDEIENANGISNEYSICSNSTGAYFISNHTNEIFEITINNKLIVHQIPVVVRELFMDRKNNLWLGGEKEKLIVFQNSKIENGNSSTYLKNQFGLARLEDRNGIVWVVSHDKPSVQFVPNREILVANSEDKILRSKQLRCMSSMRDSLIVGSSKEIISIYKDSNQNLINNRVLDLENREMAMLVHFDSIFNNLWLGTHTNGLQIIKNGERKQIKINSHGKTLYKPRIAFPFLKKSLAIIGEDQVVIIEDTTVKYVSKKTEKLIRDACCVEDSIIILLIDDKLFQLEGDSIIPVPFDHLLEGLEVGSVEYFNHELWIGVYKKGMFRLSTDELIPVNLNGSQVPSSAMNAVNDSLLIMFINCGMVSVRSDINKKYNLRLHPFKLPAGLKSSTRNGVIVKNDTLILATWEGLYYIPMFGLNEADAYPKNYINKVIIGNSPQPIQNNYELMHQDNFLQIEYGAISLKFPAEKVFYRYKLLGSINEWQLTQNKSLIFNSLTSGRYVFELQSNIMGGPWGESTLVTFNMSPPYWETWWFRGLMIALFAGLIISATTARNQIRQRQLQFQLNEVQAEQRALRAQVNPHFIFNVISSAQYLTEKAPKMASDYLGELAKLMRKILDQSFLTFVPLQSELEMTQSYLSLEQMRINNKFSFKFSIDTEVDSEKVTIPSMLLQPFVENCVKHGIQPSTKKCKILVSLKMSGQNELNIIIEDDGVGRSIGNVKIGSGHGQVSYGMKMSQERIELMNKLHGRRARLEVKDLGQENVSASGTRVSIFMTI